MHSEYQREKNLAMVRRYWNRILRGAFLTEYRLRMEVRGVLKKMETTPYRKIRSLGCIGNKTTPVLPNPRYDASESTYFLVAELS